MGLLDDAIREHLDLKRRRGGDPAEIARAEQEALSPVRREPEPAAGAEEHAETPSAEGMVVANREPEPEPAPELTPEPVNPAHADPAHAEAEHAAPAHAGEPHAEIAPAEAAYAEEPHAAESHVEAPQPHESPPSDDPRHSDIVHQPTTEFNVEHHHDEQDEDGEPAPARAADEDVLEKTPEFLQETPEHDRLWFEQRPPRDFDFDG